MEPGANPEGRSEVDALRARIAELERAKGIHGHVESALRESQERAGALLESPFEAIVITDAQGRIVSVNANALALFGYGRDELLGQPVERLVPERFRASHVAHRGRYVAEPFRRPMGRGLELAGLRRDGTEFPLDVSLSFTETADGMLFLAFIRDLSGSRRSDEARRRVEARAEALLEAASEGIVIVDRTGRIVSVNAKAEVLFGYPRTEILGRPLEILMPERLRELHVAHRDGYFADPRIRPMGRGLDLVGRRKDGSEFPIEISLSYIETEEGRQAMAFVTDITQRRVLEQASHQAERLASLGTLAAGVAHEINNPMGILNSRIEVMLMEASDRGFPADVVEDLQVLHRNVARVSRIAQGLLSFARATPVLRARVNLNDVIADTLLLARNQMGKDGIEIRTVLDPRPLFVLGHGNALEQVLLNLLTNAQAAIVGPGFVRIATELVPGSPGRVRLMVSDTGGGIPADVIPRIFDPFYTTKETGTGLGLSLAYGIIRDHNGTIDVESRPGEGTTFTLTFPEWREEPGTI
ncbi:MAG TPA: PAS domain S-box protein [Pseudomonadales bacterium]|nr:PAS domain S-box protein [Pseudomonadales bacterium]